MAIPNFTARAIPIATATDAKAIAFGVQWWCDGEAKIQTGFLP